eukprot:6953324-Pyramimonas_sp.AAC.1
MGAVAQSSSSYTPRHHARRIVTRATAEIRRDGIRCFGRAHGSRYTLELGYASAGLGFGPDVRVWGLRVRGVLVERPNDLRPPDGGTPQEYPAGPLSPPAGEPRCPELGARTQRHVRVSVCLLDRSTRLL